MAWRDLGLALVFAVAISSWTGSAASAAGGKDEPPPKHPKLALDLRASPAAEQAVRIDLTRGHPPERVAEAIRAAQGEILGGGRGFIEAIVPAKEIEALGALPGVRYVSRLEALDRHAVVTEGVQSTASLGWHAQGIRGKGVKIGVIDAGFAQYPLRQATGDLPQALETVDYCSGRLLSSDNGSVHGTAAAEIIYDVAPDASLYLICIGPGISPLQAAVAYAKAQGIRVLSMSGGYPTLDRGDGQGEPGSIERLVADAVASGITWVNSAGNYAQRHWSGAFTSAPGRQWLLFGPNDEGQTVHIPQGAEFCADLKWDEWPFATSDYDVYLYSTDISQPLAGSDRFNSGARPTERFCFTNSDPTHTTFHLAIWRDAGVSVPRLDLYTTADLQYRVAQGSIAVPATVPGVIAVGAACWQTGTVDVYSSRGPTIDGRVKPDLVGPSFVTTATYGNAAGCSPQFGFAGTSASAPHVAAAAALVLHANPTFSPAQVRTFLTSRAKDGGAPGLDNEYGGGVLQLGASPTAQPASSDPNCPNPRIDPPTATNYLPNVTKTLGGPAGFTTPFVVQNSGQVPTDLEVEFRRFSDGGCVWRRTVAALAAGSSFAATLINDAQLPAGGQFSVVVRSFGAPIVAVVNEHAGSGARAEALSYVGFASGATTVWLPNIVRRFFGYHTPFIMQNLGTAPTMVIARFAPFDGGPAVGTIRNILPGQSQFIEPNVEPGLTDGRQYAVTLTSAQPIAVVVNTHNDESNVTSPVAYSANGIAQGGFAAYGAYAAKAAINSGRPDTTSTIVVQNVGTVAVTPSLSFTPLGGGTARRFTRAAPLEAGAGWAFDPRYTNGDTRLPLCTATGSGCLPNGEFSFVAYASGPIAAVVNVISPTSAMGYSASVQPSTRFSLPNVTHTLGGASGWSTPIALQSVSATSATLSWRSFRSGLTINQTVTLPAGAAVKVDPRSVPGLTADTQYAVTIVGMRGSSPGTLSAIVIELADGADNAMIYEGFPVGALPPSANVVLTDLRFEGAVPATEADEYVELQNRGSLPQDMNGWKITSLRGGQTYSFSGLTMQPGQICRVYTNEVHPEWCALNWARSGAQWNNAGDRANLVNPAGEVVSSFAW